MKELIFCMNFISTVRRTSMTDIKWSEFKKTLNTNNYIKNPTTPTYLYVISQDTMTPCEQTMIATLQGLIRDRKSVV